MDTQVGNKTCPECSESCAIDAQFCWHCGFPVGAVSRAQGDPLVGKILPGGYNVLELIGVGGMGRVYRAQQRALGRTVAVKVIHPHLSSEQKSLARFLTEARATSQLNHPNTVSVIDFGQTDEGQPYLVMEFLRGKNLAQVVATEGLLPLPRLLKVLHQVLLALGEAHALEIIHRDLKPENIIVAPLRRGGDFVKVVDFGLAKLKADEPGSGITMPGIVCGTPDFMAPEQGRGDPIDGRSDLYAVGVVLFWLLTGRLPFEGNTPTQVVMMHITMPVPDPREIAPQRMIPDPVLNVLYRALAKDPEDRYPDAHAFADAISLLIDGLERGSQRPSYQKDAIELPQETVSCPDCHNAVPWGRFCLMCGGQLPSAKEQSGEHAVPSVLPFLGREEELRWLSVLARQAESGLVLAQLVGEHGVGKTRLLEEFASRQRQKGGTLIFGQPDPYWAEVPGYTLSTLVQRLASDIDVAKLQTLPRSPTLMVLNELLHGETIDSLTASARRKAYCRALAWALERRRDRERHPIVIVFDDLERVDGVSQQAIEDLIAERPALSALLVVAYTPQFRPRWLAALEPNDTLRVLVGLPNRVATELLQHALQGQIGLAWTNAGASVVAPLYIDQVARFSLEGGTDPPSRLADLVTHRISTLVGRPRASVQALAVLGDRVSKRLLRDFAAYNAQPDEDEADSDNAIARLINAGIIREDIDGTLSLAHPLFHDVVLLTTPAEARRELHRRAAYLFRDRGAPVEVLAEHAFLGQDVMTALLTLEQAALRASERGDDDTATHLLQRGLDLARLEIQRGELEDPLSAVIIFGRKLGETLQVRGRLSDARGVLQEALDATSPRGTDRAEVLAQLAEIAQRSNQLDEAERLLSQALSIARSSECPEGLVDGLELRLDVVRTLPSRVEI